MKAFYLKILLSLGFVIFVTCLYSICKANDNKFDYKNIESKLAETIDWIYREDYQSADSVAQAIITQSPESPAGYFIRAVISMKKGYLLKNYEDFNDTTILWLKRAIDKSKKQVKKNSNDANAYFFAGGAYGYEGAIYARQKKWIKTGMSALRGIRYLETAMALDSTMYDIYFGSGLYHVVAGNQKGIVRFIQKLLPIPTGDAKLGFEHLNIAVDKGNFTNLAAIETMAFAHIHYSKKFGVAIKLLNSLLDRYPTSIEFYNMLVNARFYQALNYNENEWQKLKKDLFAVRNFIKDRKIDLYPWYLHKFDFMEAYIHFTEKNYTKAQLQFEGYIEQYPRKNKSYLTSLSYLMIGKIHDLQGNRKAAVAAYKKVKKHETFGNEKKLADLFIKSPYKGETFHTQSRGVLTDIPDRP